MQTSSILLRSVALAAAVFTATRASALQINYDGSGTTPSISFNGDSTFTFSPTYPTTNFVLSSTSGGTGSANGLTGSLGGTFTIGAVTAVGPVNTAPVSGTGSFLINDGVNPFTANLSWVSISQFGTGSVVNTSGAINLTNITYSGSNVDLLALKGPDGVAMNVLTFNFVPAVSLETLKTTTVSTSFSGSLAPVVPDSGATVAMLGLALGTLGLIRRKFRQ